MPTAGAAWRARLIEAGSCSSSRVSATIGAGIVALKNIVWRRLGRCLQDTSDVRQESHVEHAIGLVQHQELETGQPRVRGLEVVQEASGGRDDHVHAAPERMFLRAHADAAEHGGGADRRVDGESVEILENLGRELARRRQHEGPRRAPGLRQQLLQDGQKKCRGLAAAGGRAGQHVPPGQGRRDGIGLNGCGAGEPEFLQGPREAGMQPELCKRHTPVYGSRGRGRDGRPGRPSPTCNVQTAMDRSESGPSRLPSAFDAIVVRVTRRPRFASSFDTLTSPRTIAAAGALMALAGLVLLFMGRVPICRCGYVSLWHGQVNSAGNSQHLTDWYTFSHVIHGFALYGLIWLIGRWRGSRLPIGLGLAVAVALEAGWEVLENTDMVINRYREATIALDYYGDSVLNSLSDIGAMVLGFVLAARWPTWSIVAAAVTMELVVGYLIRDNLTLNVLMLLYPIDAVRQWQMGA